MATSTRAFADGASPQTPHRAALGSLQALQPILAGFNHRNKNQHRSARWWSSFGQLRRHVDKLASELETDITAASAPVKKKRKRPVDEDAKRKSESAAEGRARWLRDVLVPKCYVAFSQAVADNQFATLGVVLLAALGQVNSVCVQLVGEQQRTEGVIAPLSPQQAPTTKVARGEPPLDAGAVDLGQVISREEVAQLEKQGNDNQGRRRRKPEGDAITSENVRADEGSMESKGKLPKKKRKKARKGDEFDDLFKGLV